MYRFRRLIGVLLAGALTGAPNMAGSSSGHDQGAATQGSPQERLNRIRADLFTSAPKVDQDIRELKDILALDPRSAEGHLLLGIAYRSVGSAEMMGEAVAELRQAISLNPELVPARFYLAHVYLDLARPARAREELEAAVAQVPGNPQFLALLGEAERQSGNPTRSVEITRRALQIDESFAQARYYLGLALFDLGQRAEAIREFERVVQSGPRAVEAYLSLGTVYVEAGRYDEAIKVLQQGATIDPARPDLRIQLAKAYRSKGLLAKAEEQLTLTQPKGGVSVASPVYQQVESDLHMERGLLKLQQGRLAGAAAAFTKVLEMDSNNGPAHRYLAEVYLLQGSYARSSEHAARAETLGSPLPEARRRLLQEKLQRKETKRQ